MLVTGPFIGAPGPVSQTPQKPTLTVRGLVVGAASAGVTALAYFIPESQPLIVIFGLTYLGLDQRVGY
ncbi:hypothetical protein GCM10009687_28230 [Asanoa iriomotensis]|uniref:Uncharacterized protein n=1 Tax=Asanoa iriomotensis TaxID=234613 RepID=A0ABQ4CBR8_9ACTN|nr:hypothetical protein Air01nite_63130 [Asanoa iriomotensis]